jgi:D-3-phosphoglycerate dehydrogenase / 2-oxoglutarate reductase
MPITAFAEAFATLESRHAVEYLQLAGGDNQGIVADPNLRITEYQGDPLEVVQRMQGVEVLIVHCAPVTNQVLDSSAALRLVGCARGGPVNVDIRAASLLGIPVVTTPGKNAVAVAEQTIAFLVMLARGFPEAQRFVTAGGRLGTSAFDGAAFFGHELGGHTLGLVGFGNVGRCVAARARPFGLNIVVFDPFLKLGPAEAVVQVDTLDELVTTADFVSLHARLTEDTENLFDSAVFGSMKHGSYFVNTAREALVDEAALDEALSSGRLAGAALDVLRPHLGDGPHPLLRHGNVVITPHIGGATIETVRRGAQMLADEVQRFDAGEALINVINREAIRT